MPRRIRHHVNPLKLGFVAGSGARLSLPAGRVVEVELGCADAEFLFARAAADPARLYVGLEIRADFIEHVNRKARLLGLPVTAVFANISADLKELVPLAAIGRFYLNFPDPWFKRRHHKRRVLSPAMALVLWERLVPGGEVFFQSDVFDLALDAMAALEEAAPRLVNVAGPWAFTRDNPFGSRSKRERQSEKRGRRIWRLWYRRPV
jgi:tRNA (guanine-N7-)-methyltransferase